MAPNICANRVFEFQWVFFLFFQMGDPERGYGGPAAEADQPRAQPHHNSEVGGSDRDSAPQAAASDLRSVSTQTKKNISTHTHTAFSLFLPMWEKKKNISLPHLFSPPRFLPPPPPPRKGGGGRGKKKRQNLVFFFRSRP